MFRDNFCHRTRREFLWEAGAGFTGLALTGLLLRGAIVSYMFEVYYKMPADPTKESVLLDRVSKLGGRLDYREELNGQSPDSICLTYEFDELERAIIAAESLRRQGQHVEGPQDY